MPIDYEELQRIMDETHSAVSDPLNEGVSEEEAIADGMLVDETEEGVSFVLPFTRKRPS
jgi:hypothetical protein